MSKATKNRGQARHRPPETRFPELDLARGVLVLAMVSYHALFSGQFLGLWSLDFSSGFLWWYPRSIAAAFLAVSGCSLSVAMGKPGGDAALARRKAVLGAGHIFALALAISAVTYFAVGWERFVAFGILHALAAMRVAGIPFARRPLLAGIAGALVIGLGIWLGQFRFPFPYLAPFGFRPEGFYPIDYLPLLPWGGWFLAGISLGAILYPRRRPVALMPSLPRSLTTVTWLGRHSLPVYVAHVPIIVGVLYLVKIAVSG